METTLTELEQSIYLQHIEEASLIYEQRGIFIADPTISRSYRAEVECRFEAHIDALFLAGNLSLKICKDRAFEGEPGELHAAVIVFCRQRQKEALLEVFENLDLGDKAKVGALVDALKLDLPTEWQEDFPSLLETGNSDFCSLVASVIGYKRIPSTNFLSAALDQHASVPLIWAAGRLREQSAFAPLHRWLIHENESVSSASSIALLRLGDQKVVGHCLNILAEQQWACIPIALGGGQSTVTALLSNAKSGLTHPDSLLALGLLGTISAIDVLLEHLGKDAASAAQALNLITGAELYEEVFIQEEVDVDELLPEEVEAFRSDGKAPKRSDGTPYGEKLNRLSQNQIEWNDWWGRNSQKFSQGLRYRNGSLFSPASLLVSMQSEKNPYRLRQLAYEELTIRYDADFPFEADLPVNEQLRVLSKMTLWLRSNESRFRSGMWYYAGQLISE